jgi:hypothetical protein
MGLGDFWVAKTDAKHFVSGRARGERETVEMPDEEATEVAATSALLDSVKTGGYFAEAWGQGGGS